MLTPPYQSKPEIYQPSEQQYEIDPSLAFINKPQSFFHQSNQLIVGEELP
jgi:hypothetical protein